MTVTIEWQLEARILPSYTSPEGIEFANVISQVTWECMGIYDLGEGRALVVVSDPGSLQLPMPTNADSYVDLTAIKGATADERRELILGWAEMLNPGARAAIEARVTDAVTAKAAIPPTFTTNL